MAAVVPVNPLGAAGVAALGLLLLASAASGPSAAHAGLGFDEARFGALDDLPAGGTLVLAGNVPDPSRADVQAVRAFLETGGRVLVASPAPGAARLVRLLDAGMELGPGTVYDPDTDFQGRFTVNPTGALAGDAVRLRGALVVSGAGQAVYVTGPFVWHDVGADGRPDLHDPRGSVAVARRLDVGAGELLVLGTPDLLRGAFRDAVDAWAGSPVVAVAPSSPRDAFGVRDTLAGENTFAVAAALAVAAVAATAIALRVRVRRITTRRRRGPVDRQTLELLAELPN